MADIYQVNGLNQYTSVKGVPISHDGNGNVTSDHHGRSFIYDAENVLRTVTGVASYRYHADGSRRQKTAAGATTEFYYMGGLGYLDNADTAFAADQGEENRLRSKRSLRTRSITARRCCVATSACRAPWTNRF
ncbi:MAG: hypothetical protein AAGB02_00225 [Pseudomonadota bacterium]